MSHPTQPRNEEIPIDPALLRGNIGQSTSTFSAPPPQNSPRGARTPVTIPASHRSSTPLSYSVSDFSSISSDADQYFRHRIQELESTVNNQDKKIAYLEKKMQRWGSALKRLLDQAGWESDDEEEPIISTEAANKKRFVVSMTSTNRPLTSRQVRQLTDREKRVRKDLNVSRPILDTCRETNLKRKQNFLSDRLRLLAGTPPDMHVPPAYLDPGTHTLPDGREVMTPDFKKDVTDKVNWVLVTQAATLVYKEQTVSIVFLSSAV